MSHTPPALNPRALSRALLVPAGPFGRVEVLASIASTNSELAARAVAEAAQWPDLSVMIADEQTAGRGRLDRTWEVPAGMAMISSVLVRPGRADASSPPASFLLSGYGWLSILAGIALCQAVGAATAVPMTLKWPNDVLVHGHKVAGILAQVVPSRPSHDGATPSAPPSLVVGVGLNVSQSRDFLPVDRATSLALVSAQELDRNALLPAYLLRFAALYREFAAVNGDATVPLPGGESLRSLAGTLMTTLGQQVRAELPGGALVRGQAVALDAEGALIIVDAGGARHTVSAGDVVHVRRMDGTAVHYA